MRILVTGANSQLGRCLRDEIKSIGTEDQWIFRTHEELDITNENSIVMCFAKDLPDVVEKAEDEFYQANLVNCIGVHYLSEVCQKTSTFLIHISTDYVYKQIDDDMGFTQDEWYENMSKVMMSRYAFNENDKLEPLNKYGITKYLGERILMQGTGSMIIRSSWLYSEYGKNFVKTMIKKLNNGELLNVVCDQVGRPTNAHDLAKFIVGRVIGRRLFNIEDPCSIVNFQNSGLPCSWHKFATEIAECWQNGNPYSINKVKSSELAMKATRPAFSVMSLEKAISIFGSMPEWSKSLRSFINDNRWKLI